jgi:hypothetical protein
LIREIHRHRLVDVQQENEQQPDFHRIDERVAQQRMRVLVEEPGAEEDEQVAGDVQDQIQEKREAGDADEDLRADRAREHAEPRRHQTFSLLLRQQHTQVSIKSFFGPR